MTAGVAVVVVAAGVAVAVVESIHLVDWRNVFEAGRAGGSESTHMGDRVGRTADTPAFPEST